MFKGHRIAFTLALAALLGVCNRASALQPVSAFLRGAKQHNHDNRESAFTDAQRQAEVDVARGRLYPAFSASGSYTRNQYEVALALPANFAPTAAANMGNAMEMMAAERLVIQPRNQFDANLTLSVPLFDLSSIERLGAAAASAEASAISRRATELDVENQVLRAYYQLLGQEAVLISAKSAREVSQATLALVQDKLASGTASELDVQRGRAEIARADGDVASAELAVVTARRQLSTLAFVEPEPATAFVDDDLHDEAALASWLQKSGATPRAQLAAATRRAADKSEQAAEAAWLPTLSANAQERFTNATSFSGHAAVYLIQATLAWRIDATVPASVRAQNAALQASAVREEKAQRAAEDAIYNAWHQVRVSIEKARAARAQIAAARLAAELARDRYGVGAATQLDVLRAQEDAFRADVTRIQADTDLAYARAALRVSAGLLQEGKEP